MTGPGSVLVVVVMLVQVVVVTVIVAVVVSVPVVAQLLNQRCDAVVIAGAANMWRGYSIAL